MDELKRAIHSSPHMLLAAFFVVLTLFTPLAISECVSQVNAIPNSTFFTIAEQQNANTFSESGMPAPPGVADLAAPALRNSTIDSLCYHQMVYAAHWTDMGMWAFITLEVSIFFYNIFIDLPIPIERLFHRGTKADNSGEGA